MYSNGTILGDDVDNEEDVKSPDLGADAVSSLSGGRFVRTLIIVCLTVIVAIMMTGAGDDKHE
jgi:hypothetical protein